MSTRKISQHSGHIYHGLTPYSSADWWKNLGEIPSDPLPVTKKLAPIVKAKKRWSIIYVNQGQALESEIERKFNAYASQWKKDMRLSSSLTDIFGNMNYLRVIGLGEKVIPLILRDLQSEPAPWFVALKALTNEDSIGRDTPGDFRKIAQAWIQWGKKRGHIR